MRNSTPVDASRVRKITGFFSWLDHRLLTHGFVARMTRYQVLHLPACAMRLAHAERESPRGGEFRALTEIFKQLRERD
jgi:hypothetical protein